MGSKRSSTLLEKVCMHCYALPLRLWDLRTGLQSSAVLCRVLLRVA